VEYARGQGADESVVKALSDIPDHSYDAADEVTEAVIVLVEV
jgi:hypothetical protein